VAACLIGNSSAGIKECSYLGTPVVNIGARQQGRLHAETSCTPAIRRTVSPPPSARRSPTAATPPRRSTTGAGASQAIVDVLAGVELYTQKRFCDNREARPPA